MIGGCSTHNACMLAWGAASDYDGWGEGWSAAGLQPYRLRAKEAIGARRRPDPGAWNDAVHAAAVEVGFAAIAYLDPARGERRRSTIARCPTRTVPICESSTRRLR